LEGKLAKMCTARKVLQFSTTRLTANTFFHNKKMKCLKRAKIFFFRT